MRKDSKFTAREDFYADVLTTAVEGGVRYWARVIEYEHGMVLDDGPVRRVELPTVTLCDASAFLGAGDVDDEQSYRMERVQTFMDGVQDVVAVHVDVETVRRGWNALLSDPSIAPNLAETVREIDRTLDAGEVDAGRADCVVQVGAFGEIVFW